MMPAQSGTEVGVWTVPGYPVRIEYSRSVLSEIVSEVCDAFESYLGGGYEVGGVLYGVREEFTLRILAYRALEIQPPRPSFVLSESDSRKLDQLLEQGLADPELQGMAPLGWYHSHTRSEIFLSEGDLEVYNRHFPEPWQIAMVLHPSEFEPVRIGFFFREPDGFIRADQSYQEFAVEAPLRPNRLRKTPPWKLDSFGQPEDPVLEAGPSAGLEAYELAPEPSEPPLRRRWQAWAFALLAVIALAASIYSIWILRQAKSELGLRVTAEGEHLRIEWNRASPAFRQAQKAELIVREGEGSERIILQPGQSHVLYRPRSSRLDLVLRTSPAGQTMEERMTFVYHPNLHQPARALEEVRKRERELLNESQILRQELDQQLSKNQELQERVAALRQERERERQAPVAERMTPGGSSPSKPEIREAADPRRLSPFPLTGNRTGKVLSAGVKSSETQLPAVSLIESPPVAPAPPAPPPLPLLTSVQAPSAMTPRLAPTPLAPPVASPAPASLAGLPPAAAPPRPAPANSTSGRLLWVGELAKGAELSIQGKKASRGSVLSGELPAGALRVGAYPAELGAKSLRVYTANPAFATKPRTEPPSAANGWNMTEYVYDPKSLNQVIVERTPGSGSQSALTLRAGNKKVSVIVIEWQLANP